MNVGGNLVPVDGRREISPDAAFTPAQPFRDEGEKRSGFWEALHRTRWVILALTLLGIAAGALYAHLTPPVYRAEAALQFAGSGDQEGARTRAASQVRVLESRALAEKAADVLGLERNPAAAQAFGLNATASGADKEALVSRLHAAVDADVPTDSAVVTFGLASRDPAMSASLANQYLDIYQQTELQQQQESADRTRRLLGERLAQTKAELGTAERALVNYTRSAGLIDPSAGTSSVTGGSAPHSLNSEKLAQMTEAYTRARADRMAAEQRWQEAQRTPAMSLPEVLGNPAVQQLTQKSAEAQATLERERQRRLDTHPDVQGASAQIAEIDRQIDAVGANVKRSIRERYQVAMRQEQDMAGAVSRLQNQTLSDQGKGLAYNRLKREADSKRQLHDTLLAQLNQAAVQSGQIANLGQVIDPATPPSEPTSPKPILASLVGGLIGLALGLLYLLVNWLRDDALYSPDSLARELNLKVLGVLPKIRNPAEALLDPRSPLSEAHYALRGSLEASSARNTPQVLLFTSSGPGEGKSTAAWGTARDFALSGRRTLIIDGDMRRPSLHNYVDVSSPLGLSTLLADMSTVEASILRTSTPDLDIMPAGPAPASPASLLSGKEFKALLKRLARDYETVVIDAPPVLGLADAPRMAAAAGRTVFVVESGRTRMNEVRGALRRLADGRARFAGVLLTKFDPSRSASANLYVYDYGDRPTRLIPAFGAQG